MIRFVTILLITGSIAIANENPRRSVEQLVTELRKECESPTSPDEPEKASYLSATERIRWGLLLDLVSRKDEALPVLKAKREKAEGDYREMLTIALALVGDSPGVAETRKLLTEAISPAVRICAARILRQAKDEDNIEVLKKALKDSYNREDGSCINIGDGRCYPVRIIAGDALVELGLTRKEVKELEGKGKKDSQPVLPAGAGNSTAERQRRTK